MLGKFKWTRIWLAIEVPLPPEADVQKFIEENRAEIEALAEAWRDKLRFPEAPEPRLEFEMEEIKDLATSDLELGARIIINWLAQVRQEQERFTKFLNALSEDQKKHDEALETRR